MAGIKFTFTGDNQDVLKKINQIQTELKKVYNKQNTNIDLSNGIDFSLLGENFKRLDQQSREAFDSMSKDAQKYIQEIQQNTLSLQQLEKMQAGLNSLFEDGDIDLNTYIQSQARLTVLHDELSKGINESRAALEAETTTTKIAVDSIAGLHAKVLMLTTDYMNLSKAQREGMEGAALLKNLQETQAQLDNASLSMDRYASGAKSKFDSLGMSITQIARELPSLAMGPQMFFLAISNNLGPFQDALAAARKEYKDTIAAGKDAIPVWKQLLSSLKGSGPILALITTLFVAFGDDIIKWVGKLISGKKEMKSFLSVAQEMALGIRKGMKDAAASTTELDVLYKATQNHTRSLKERNKAVDELQKKYPSYFGNLSNEAVLAGKAKDAYAKLRGELVANAIARAQLDRMTDIANKREDVLLKRRVQYNTYLKAQQKINEASAALEEARQKRAQQQGGDDVWGYQVAKRTKDLEKAQKQAEKEKTAWQKIVDEVQKYDNTLSGMAKNVDVSALTNKPGETDIKEINAYSDHLHRIAELQSKSSRERIRLEVELTNQVEQARIDAMQDGFDKEQAQRELNNKIELQTIERQKQDYINKIVDIQRQIFEAEENAKATKDKNYKKRTFNASSVSVDTSMFDVMDKATRQKQAKETADFYNDILSKYQDYTEKRLDAEKRYRKDLDKLEKAGGTDAQKAELSYQREETLKSIDKEFAMRENTFQSWANKVTDISLKELQRLLTDAERELERMEFGNKQGFSNSQGLAEQRAKVAMLKEQINTANKKASTSPDKRSVKEWQDLYKTLSKVEKEFEELGGTIGGTAGEAFSAAGGITTSTLSMINSIMSLGTISADNIQGVSTATAEAIASVEKASVILAIVSAALQIATKIMSFFKQDDGIAEYEKARDTYNAYIEVLDKVIDKQLELAETLSGENAKAAYQEAIDLIQKQSDAAKELGKAYLNSGASKGFLGIGSSASRGKKEVEEMSAEGWIQAAKALGMSVQQFKDAMGGRMTGLFDLTEKQLVDLQRYAPSFWAQLDEDTKNYANQIVDGVEQIMDVLEREMEAATGVSWDSFSSDILDSLYDVEKGAKDIADDIGDYMRKALIKSMYVKQYEPLMRKWYEKWANFMEDGGLSDSERSELEALKESIINGATESAKIINEQWGGASLASQDSTKRGFEAMSQDTAEELNGRFTALQMSGEESKTQLVLLNQVTNALLAINREGYSNILIQMVQTNSYLEDIVLYIKALKAIKDDIAAVKNNTAGLTRL